MDLERMRAKSSTLEQTETENHFNCASFCIIYNVAHDREIVQERDRAIQSKWGV